MGLQLRCLWICWMGSKAVLLAFRRSKRCRKSRSWCKSAYCMLRRLRNAKQIDTAGMWSMPWARKVLLSTKNLRLKLPRKLQDRYMGPFEVLKRVGPIAYKLDLSHSSALKMIHLVFHISLLRDFEDNGLR